jgi:hypothetical protein
MRFSMVFALCFGQPRKKRGGKPSIGRATATAKLGALPEKNNSVTRTARKEAVEKKNKEKKRPSKALQQNNHMQDASHQSNC